MELKTLEIPEGVTVMEDGRPFFFEGKGKIGCLLIHGFTGTTSSMKPMGEYLAGKGVTVLGPRLPGHGTDVKDMARWTRGDWISTVETALDELSSICEKVFVAGLSMGGTLTLYLGENHSDELSGIAPISAAASRLAPSFLETQALKVLPVLKRVLKTFPGPGGDIKDPSVTEVAYEKLSTEALHELVKLIEEVKGNLGRITLPVRIFHSLEDHVVAPENATCVYDRISSADKELIWLDNSFHVATLDYDKEKIFENSYNFFLKVAG